MPLLKFPFHKKGSSVLHNFFLFSKHLMKQNLKKVKNTTTSGRYGETLALNFLISKGYKHILSNFWIRGGEIDLIMEKNGILVFVEVKSRWSNFFGPAEEAITWRKKQKLLRTINTFREAKKNIALWRLDLIAIDFTTISQAKVQHFKNIYADE